MFEVNCRQTQMAASSNNSKFPADATNRLKKEFRNMANEDKVILGAPIKLVFELLMGVNKYPRVAQKKFQAIRRNVVCF